MGLVRGLTTHPIQQTLSTFLISSLLPQTTGSETITPLTNSMASKGYPSTASGGCLCGSVRYKVTFPTNHDWKRGVNITYSSHTHSPANALLKCSTCQCSQCRKNGGSLIAWLHKVPASSVAFTSQTTLSRYHATPDAARGFCTKCGSWLFWRSEASNSMSMSVGTFDKEELKQWGQRLSYSEVHLWSEDAIEGISDHLPGEKWKYDDEGEGAERIG